MAENTSNSEMTPNTIEKEVLDALISSFTINDEIDNFPVDQITIEMSGYVDGIEEIVKGDENCTHLLKIIINNGQGRRVRVLFWGAAAKKYSEIISDRAIVSITCGKSRLIVDPFRDPGLAPVEIFIQAFTTVDVSDVKYPKI